MPPAEYVHLQYQELNQLSVLSILITFHFDFNLRFQISCGWPHQGGLGRKRFKEIFTSKIFQNIIKYSKLVTIIKKWKLLKKINEICIF